MKRVKTNNLSKKIICIMLTVLMLCNFISPSTTYAASDEDSGPIFAPISSFITFLCDSIMQFLQNTFTSVESIKQGDDTYNFQYSPAIIFSGTVPALDINFITPNTEANVSNSYGKYIKDNIRTYFDAKNNDNTGYENAKKRKDRFVVSGGFVHQADHTYYTAYYWVENDILYIECEFDRGSALFGENSRYFYYSTSYSVNAPELQGISNGTEYTSIALELQPIISTWYNALRRISLVGLLSVLVYIGIQIILTSASGKENSKYKKMLTDWLIALCLLFTLHYIMSATLLITQKLSNIFNDGEKDVLLNTLRMEIDTGKTWEEVVAQVIMYVILTFATVMFTFQYLKRVLYMGFFTMIAPLVTLTYPLDKIKDSKAQAFTMWIREYIFNALIQVIHLVIYYTLVGSALDLVKIYPIYGVLAILLMTQAENIIRKMFGFNNATTVGTMGAAATGGLVAAALNKLQKASKPNKKTDDSKENSKNNNIRTVSNSIANNLRGGQAKPGFNANAEPDRKSGAKAVAKKYGIRAAKSIGSATLKTVSTGVGALFGFANGVTKGDISEAFKGAAAGGAIGRGLTSGGINFAKNTGENVKKFGNDIQDTWNEGAHGKEYAQDVKRLREFKQTNEYKELKNEFGDKLTDDKLNELLKAAIKEQENKK